MAKNENERADSLRFWGSDGRAHCLKDFRGQNLVICFLDGDDSLRSRHEAKLLRDHRVDFLRHNAKVVGVSCDPVSVHQRFADDFEFPGLLLSDPEGRLQKALGAKPGESSETVIIDAGGHLTCRWSGLAGEDVELDAILSSLDEGPHQLR